MVNFEKNLGYKSHQYVSSGRKNFKFFIVLILIATTAAVGYSFVEGANSIERAAPLEVASK